MHFFIKTAVASVGLWTAAGVVGCIGVVSRQPPACVSNNDCLGGRSCLGGRCQEELDGGELPPAPDKGPARQNEPSPDGPLVSPPEQRQSVTCNSWLPSRDLQGHLDSVYGLVFHPTSYLLASSGAAEYGTGSSKDKIIRLWKSREGSLIGKLEGHTEGVNTLAISPDGTLLASGSIDMTIRLWDLATQKTLRILRGHTSTVGSVAFSPDGKFLASGGFKGDESLRLWEVATGKELKKFTAGQFFGYVLGLAFSPDGKKLLSVGSRAILWDTLTGKQLASYPSTDALRAAAFSPNGQYFAFGQTDGKVDIVDAHSLKKIRTIAAHNDRVVSVAFTADSKIIASASWDRTVRFWWVSDGKPQFTLKTGHSSNIRSMALHPNNMILATGASDNIVKTWKCY